MGRKHNTKHRRSLSRYPERLRARGEGSATVRMADIETLRRRQVRAGARPIRVPPLPEIPQP